MIAQTHNRIMRGNWSLGRRLPDQAEFDYQLLDEFKWGHADCFGVWHSCDGVCIEVDGIEIRMDRKVLESLTT